MSKHLYRLLTAAFVIVLLAALVPSQSWAMLIDPLATADVTPQGDNALLPGIVGGRIYDPADNDLPNITVQLVDDVPPYPVMFTTTSGTDGVYIFNNVPNGDYFVRPQQAGYTFDPTWRYVDVDNNTQADKHFEGTRLDYDLGGRIDDNNQYLNGITVHLFRLPNTTTPISTTTTSGGGSNTGRYTFNDVPGGDDYRIVPESTQYSFEPTQIDVNDLGSNQTSHHFEANPRAYDASGRVTLNSSGMGNVTLTLNTGATTTTDSAGNYTFQDLPPGSYTVTPSFPGYSFSPTNRPFTISNANVNNLDFFASQLLFDASGRVTLNGNGLAGVLLTLNSNPARYAQTDSNGNYVFVDLPLGNYTVTPSLSGYSFTPPNRNFTITTGDVNGLDFTATQNAQSASGRVTLNGGGLAGVVMTLSNGITTTTELDGSYSFDNLQPGEYTVTPSLGGYSFQPPSRTFTIFTQPVTNLDFVATQLRYDASGRVTLNGNGLQNVIITLTTPGNPTPIDTTVTDANGNYTFPDLLPDLYIVTPSRGGYSFAPLSRSFEIVNSDVTGLDFTATEGRYFASGRVMNDGVPVEDVTITLTSNGVEVGVTTTDSGGNYRFDDLAQGAYTVTPRLALYSFVPPLRNFSVLTGDVTGLDFEANTSSLFLPLAQRNQAWAAPTPSPTPTVMPTATATPQACRNEIEPNALANADANGNFEPNRCINGAIPTGDANDFYRIQFPGGTFDSSLTQIPTGTNYQLALYNLVNGQANLIDASTEPGNADEHLVIQNLPAGVYYIGVQRLTGNSPQQYRLIWTRTP